MHRLEALVSATLDLMLSEFLGMANMLQQVELVEPENIDDYPGDLQEVFGLTRDFWNARRAFQADFVANLAKTGQCGNFPALHELAQLMDRLEGDE